MKETYLVAAQMAYLRFTGDEEEDGSCTPVSFFGHEGGSGEVAQSLGRTVGDRTMAGCHSILRSTSVGRSGIK